SLAMASARRSKAGTMPGVRRPAPLCVGRRDTVHLQCIGRHATSYSPCDKVFDVERQCGS
ncbi:hypothetical protein HAX54_047541, partial [Datura stramonium]|nr:hypothetical protein [Datura stramonium]